MIGRDDLFRPCGAPSPEGEGFWTSAGVSSTGSAPAFPGPAASAADSSASAANQPGTQPVIELSNMHSDSTVAMMRFIRFILLFIIIVSCSIPV